VRSSQLPLKALSSQSWNSNDAGAASENCQAHHRKPR